MVLGELIERLKKENPDKVVKLGFHDPHSNRGYYDQLGFKPKENVRVGDMLNAALVAMGNTYTGYKGGEYTMGPYTEVNLSRWGESGESIGETFLELLLSNEVRP